MPHPHRPLREEAASPLVDEPGHLPVEPDEGPAMPQPVPTGPVDERPVPEAPQ